MGIDFFRQYYSWSLKHSVTFLTQILGYATVVVWVIYLCLSPMYLSAQIGDHEYDFSIYKIEDGLPDNTVNKIAQDNQGFIWIATNNGLSRYDGSNFINYTTFDKTHFIRRNQINDFHIGSDGRIYLATDLGIDILDANTGELTSILPSELKSNGLIGDEVNAIFLDHSNRLWVTTDQGFSYQYTDDLTKFNYGPPLKVPDQFDHNNQYVSNYIELEEQLYALAGLQEVWSLENTGLVGKKYGLPVKLEYESTASPYGIAIDKEGTIWTSFLHSGLYTIRTDDSTLTRHPISDQLKGVWKTALEVNEDEDIWIGGIDMLNLYDRSSAIVIDFSQDLKKFSGTSQLRIFDLHLDHQNNLWIGSDLGLIKLTKKASGFAHYMEGQAVRAMEEDSEDSEGSLFIGRLYSVDIMNPVDGSIRKFPVKNNNDLGSADFHIDPSTLLYHENTLWIRGKNSYNFNTAQYIERSTESWFDYVHTVDAAGRHWVGGANLLEIYDEDNQTYSDYIDPVDSLDVTTLNVTALKSGLLEDMWVGTDAGLYHMDINEGTLERYGSDHHNSSLRLSDAPVISICQMDVDHVWVGTWGGGLNLLNTTDNGITIKTQLDGLPSNFISGIIALGDSVLWISTNNGLSRYDIKQDFFSNFSEEDGLLNTYYQKYSCLKTSDGRLYFGGDKGIDAFYPNDIEKTFLVDQDLTVRLTQVSHFDDTDNNQFLRIYNLDQLEKIELAHNNKLLNLRFSIMDYESPDDHLYSWRMSGYNEEWSLPSHRNEAMYSHLPPGRYTFELRATTGRIPWNQPQLSIPIIINEAWFQNTWLRLLAAVLVGLLIFIGTKRNFLLKLKRQEEMDSLRTQISSDLHDDVGTMLSGLSMQAEVLEYKAIGEEKKLLSEISQTSRDAMDRMRDTVWAIDSRQDRYVNLIDRIREHAERTLYPADIGYKISSEGLTDEGKILPNHRQQLYLIAKEAITNIIKHAQATQVSVKLIKSKKDILLIIKDNGIGNGRQLKEQISTGQGLENINMRAQRIGGRAVFNTDEGFSIEIRIPLV